MQNLIAGYLFQYRKVALPSVGTLEVKYSEAVSVAGEQMIKAPVPSVVFTEQSSDAGALIGFIAANKHVSNEEAANLLNRFCEEIRMLNDADRIIIDGAGTFSKDADGNIVFVTEELAAHFLPDTNAVRVIHPDKAHSILVGDKETDSNVMAEYYAEETPQQKRRWWIAAAILFVIAVGTVLVYLNDANKNDQFGISRKYEVKERPATYQKIQ